MIIESPRTQDEILAAFQQQESESVAYWEAFETDDFFRQIGTSWSPAETVRHLSKSTRPVVKALTMPKILLRVRFGKPGRASLTYDALRARYLDALAAGGEAGRFAPSRRAENDLGARRAIMAELGRVNAELRTAISRWSERKLDRLQLPHPLLGKLTVREMLFFTLYHHRHHIGVVERRRSETLRSP